MGDFFPSNRASPKEPKLVGRQLGGTREARAHETDLKPPKLVAKIEFFQVRKNQPPILCT